MPVEISSAEDFLRAYFINPIVLNQGYNPINTTVYALMLVIAAYLVYRALSKMKVKIDRRLGIAIAPFIVFGSSSRVVVDAGIFFSFIFTTPLIYFVVFAAAFTTLVTSLYLEEKKKIPYHKTMFVVGIFLAIIPLSILFSTVEVKNFSAVLPVLIFFAPWPLFFHLIKWKDSNKTVASVHMFDATSTFVSLKFFGYSEQHFVPNIFIGALGPESFIIVKAAVIIGALILIDRFSEDKNFNNYLKLVIGILGGATSTRDFLRLLTGV